MDVDDWEFIPDDGFLEIHDDGGKKIYSRKYVKDSSNNISSVFNMNYFKSPDITSVESTEVSRVPNQLVPLPINFQQNSPDDDDDHHHQLFVKPSLAPEQDLVSQVFFKKMKENEFVDMKMDSPKSGGILPPQVEAAAGGKFQFEVEDDEGMEATPRIEEQSNSDDDNGVNMWKWGLTGMGAICSFGVAATATICIIILGCGTKNRHHHHKQLGFQIYADDNKRINEVVQQASRLNGALSAARGIPLARAHITYGGYYEGL